VVSDPRVAKIVWTGCELYAADGLVDPSDRLVSGVERLQASLSDYLRYLKDPDYLREVSGP